MTVRLVYETQEGVVWQRFTKDVDLPYLHPDVVLVVDEQFFHVDQIRVMSPSPWKPGRVLPSVIVFVKSDKRYTAEEVLKADWVRDVGEDTRP